MEPYLEKIDFYCWELEEHEIPEKIETCRFDACVTYVEPFELLLLSNEYDIHDEITQLDVGLCKKILYAKGLMYIYKTMLYRGEVKLPRWKSYVGLHVPGKERESWKTYPGSGTYFTHALNTYGKENARKEFICICNSKEELDKAEIFYIKFYRTTDPKIGYNILLGGQCKNKFGIRHSKETRRKISLSNIGRHAHNKGKPSPFKGVPRSEETVKKLRAAAERKRGIPRSPEICKKMSDGMKGKHAYNKGIPCSEEQKKKQRLAHKNRSPEEKRITSEKITKAKTGIPVWNKGKSWSDEVKIKMKASAAKRKGKKLPEAHKQKIRDYYFKSTYKYNNFRQIRQNLGISIAIFSKMLGIHQSLYSKFEYHQSRFKSKNAECICAVLNLPVSEVFWGLGEV